MRQGVLGLKVSIMGTLTKKVDGETIVMPDYIKIHDPKNEEELRNVVPSVVFARAQGGDAPM